MENMEKINNLMEIIKGYNALMNSRKIAIFVNTDELKTLKMTVTERTRKQDVIIENEQKFKRLEGHRDIAELKLLKMISQMVEYKENIFTK